MITLTLTIKTYARLPGSVTKHLNLVRLRWGRAEFAVDHETFAFIRAFPFRDSAIRKAFALPIL